MNLYTIKRIKKGEYEISREGQRKAVVFAESKKEAFSVFVEQRILFLEQKAHTTENILRDLRGKWGKGKDTKNVFCSLLTLYKIPLEWISAKGQNKRI